MELWFAISIIIMAITLVGVGIVWASTDNDVAPIYVFLGGLGTAVFWPIVLPASILIGFGIGIAYVFDYARENLFWKITDDTDERK